MWFWIFLGVLAALGVLFLLFVVVMVIAVRRGLAQGAAELETALNALELEEIDAKVDECVRVALERLDVRLDIEDWEQSSRALGAMLCVPKRKQAALRAFEKPGLSYNLFLATGAFLGELLQRHARGVWKKGDAEPYMELQLDDGLSTTWPFSKLQKQFWEGDPDDLFAYVHMSVHAEDYLGKLEEQEFKSGDLDE
ncbi:MAG: hypothetical protein WDZ59_17460 [Pirellulales bacterium]